MRGRVNGRAGCQVDGRDRLVGGCVGVFFGSGSSGWFNGRDGQWSVGRMVRGRWMISLLGPTYSICV